MREISSVVFIVNRDLLNFLRRVLVVIGELIHQNVGLGRDDLDSTLTLLDLAALDFRVVTAVDLDTRAVDVVNIDTEDFLLGSFTLKVNADDLAVCDFGVHYLHLVDGLGLREDVEATGLEVLE